MTTTFERLIKILMKTYKLDPATMTPQLRLDEIGVDSLGVGLLLFDVEDEFQIKFERDPGPLQTLADVVAYIDQVMSEQQFAPRLAAVSKASS
jgi:acyl carrier protein